MLKVSFRLCNGRVLRISTVLPFGPTYMPKRVHTSKVGFATLLVICDQRMQGVFICAIIKVDYVYTGP